MTLKTVFFDLDGTLLDTSPDLSHALNRLLKLRNKSPLPESEIRKVVSDGAYAMLKLGFGVEQGDPETAGLRKTLLDFYLDDLSSRTVFFPGIEELISRLAENNIGWGIVTNKPEVYTAPLIEGFRFPSRPLCVICPEHVTHRKPHAEPLLLACQQADCSIESAVYIGDHVRDIECGINAKMKTIAVNYGYIAADDSAHNWGADYVVETGDEIWPLLAENI